MKSCPFVSIFILSLQANPFANVDEKEDIEAYQKQVEDKKLQEQGENLTISRLFASDFAS